MSQVANKMIELPLLITLLIILYKGRNKTLTYIQILNIIFVVALLIYLFL